MNSKESYINEIYKLIKKNLYIKYLTTPQDYRRDLITKIIFQDQFKLLSQYKEMLLYTDPKEFLKRFYHLSECKAKIKCYCDFYEENSKIFPNYVPLPEAKYIFKNIKKKQKMLDNINENDEKENKKNHNNSTRRNIIFSSSVINSIMSETSSAILKGDISLVKLIDKIYLNESESFTKDNESISINKNNSHEFINSNNVKIDYSYKNSPFRKNKNVNINYHNKIKKKINENIPSKKNSKDKIIQKLNIKKNNQQNNNNINKIMKKLNFCNVVKDMNIMKFTNKIINEKNKSKSKSKSKSKEILTERIHKTKINNSKKILNETKRLKSVIENYSSKQRSFNIQTKQESQSAPKTQNNKNINYNIKKLSPNKQNLSGNKNKNKYTPNIQNIKSQLKFTNIKLQKPINKNIIHNYSNNINPALNNNYTLLLKHIPSLHISINTNIKSNSTLSKSKSKSHSKSKSPSNGSLNKNIKQNSMTRYKKNIQNLNKNLKSLIQKDGSSNNVDNIHTERINKSNSNQMTIRKKTKINSQGNLNNNILKRNYHKKIISSATSSEYTKLIPKIGRDSLTNSFGVNKGKLVKNNTHKLKENNSNNKKYSSINKSNILARSINNINLNNTLQKLNNHVINSRTRSSSSNRKSNKQISSNTNSSNIVKRAVKKIKNFEKNKPKKITQNKGTKSVLSNTIKNEN